MSTNYWINSSVPIGESYLASDQFPQILIDEDGYVKVPYADSKGIPTIGIGAGQGRPGAHSALPWPRIKCSGPGGGAQRWSCRHCLRNC